MHIKPIILTNQQLRFSHALLVTVHLGLHLRYLHRQNARPRASYIAVVGG
jgi:hypothetical protein